MESPCAQYIGNCTCIDYTDEQQFNLKYFLTYGIFATSIIVVGLIGNFLSVVVLCRPSVWTTHNYYLTALIAWDTGLLISSFLQFSLWVLTDPNGLLRHYGSQANFLSYVYIFLNTTMTGSVWILVSLTAQRYLAISQPYQHTANHSGRKARKIVLICSSFACIVNIPRGFELTVSTTCVAEQTHINGSLQLTTVAVLQMSDFTLSEIYFPIFRIGVDLVLVFLAPLLTLSVLTFLMYKSIREAKALRRTMTHSTMELTPTISNNVRRSRRFSRVFDTSANTTLLIVIVKFISCYSLPATLNVMELLLPHDNFLSSQMEGLSIGSNLLVIFNSACNFFIFYTNGTRFRRETKRTLARLSVRRHKATGTSDEPLQPDILYSHCRQSTINRKFTNAVQMNCNWDHRNSLRVPEFV